MDFQYTPAQEAFRDEVRGWLEQHLPADLCVDDPFDERVASNRATFEKRVIWQRKMYEARWVGISWPAQYGGRAATLMEQIIFDEEYFRARAPVLPGYSGVNMAGPTIIEWGTEEQKRRFLPRILSGEDIWCQGYSEPGAGSDLAGLATRAEDRGDHFVVNGQKVRTSAAQFADWIYVLVRTDPAAPKHRGISYLLADMKTPGITVRPLVLMNGHRHFNEVFFVDVPVPKANLIGRQNEGWKPAMTTLMYERKAGGGRGYGEQLQRLRALAGELRVAGRPAWEDPLVRQGFAQLWIDSTCLRYTRLRNITRQLRGEPPGPEGSILKLFGSELGVRIADFAGELLGPRVLVNQPSVAVPDGPRWYNRVVSARQYTNAGGTSEIQRNIIGERVLGLPKD
ncbi:MAG: acyl-CoA dehydrogenase family protein [Candidatus Rokubacteria bacterium]|nr:acyl-CoA dehydrogenase family protein [Candidatus Rokubacteria bacterium]